MCSGFMAFPQQLQATFEPTFELGLQGADANAVVMLCRGDSV
jgi:hypothetical protein